MCRFFKELIRCRLIAEHAINTDIGRRVVPEQGGVRLERLQGIGHEGQGVSVNTDPFGCAPGLFLGLGNDHGYTLADIADLVIRQQIVGIDDNIAITGTAELDVIIRRRHRTVGNGLQAVPQAILTGENSNNPGHVARLIGTYGADAAVGDIGSGDGAVTLVFRDKVIGKLSASP